MIDDESPLADGPPPRQGKGRSGTLAEYSLEELVARWEEFFAEQGLESAIIGLADRYPEDRSLAVRFEDLNRFDTDMSIHLLRQPLNVLAAGEEAIRRVVPPTEEPVEIHLRVEGLPRDSRVQIRDLRAKHLGRFIAVEGLVRKATEVRPMVVDALFQCLRCGTVIKEPQEGQSFREPMECYEDQGGCKRSASATKFKLLGEASRYLDTQKIEIQEAPEGLRGGEEPRRLSAFTEDDLTGKITPGMRVVLNGILRSSQRGKPGQKSTLFDIMLDVNAITLEQVEFEEIEVTEEDVKRIEAEAADPDIFRKIVASIAPSLYGLTTEKEGLALQLFSGVPKVMPDGRRIRGDIHVILVGDPGCLVADERIVLGNGTLAKLGSLGHAHLEPLRTQVRLGTGGYRNGWATRFHRYEGQPILEVVTETGKCIKGTYNHPLLAWNRATRSGEWRRLDELRVGDRLQVADSIRCWKQALVPTGWTEPDYYHRSWHVKVPESVDEGLAAILGYVLGDGWIQDRRIGYTLADEESDLGPKLASLFERVFGVRPRRAGHRGRATQFQVNRTPIARWLRGLREKRVPDVILQSRNSVVSAFLRWLFEADGSCFTRGRGRTAITLRSVEIELLRDVQTLLLRWGIHSSILWGKAPHPHVHRGGLVRGGPSGSLVIRRSNSILRYSKRIGFESQKKNARLLEVVQYVRTRARRWHGQRLERIVSIRPAGVATVYDIEVPGPQRFIANGIISHNTAKSELLSYMSRLSPRGIYATGKAASAAGLTAAAVRDEFGEGRWTLEAGALVLADKGLACLHPDAEVLINGVPTAAKDVFEATAAFAASAGGKRIELSPLDSSVVSFDIERLVGRNAQSTFATRRRYTGPILRLTLDSGFELSLTPDHLVLNGDTLEWGRLEDLGPKGRLVACQRLPGRTEPIHILDIVPDDWIVGLTSGEKTELRVPLLRKLERLSNVNRTYGLSRDALSGRGAIRVDRFRQILRDLDLYDEWKRRPLAYGRSGATERLRVATITPELSYVLGFVYGDGHVSVTSRRSSVSIFQSAVHLPYIQRVLHATKRVSSRAWGMHERTTVSEIRGRSTASRGYHMHRGSNLLAFLHEWLTSNDLANLLHLHDEALRGFVAGVLDSDGCVSIKSSKNGSISYNGLDIEFLFSSSRKSNLRFMYALRRFDVFSRLREVRGVFTVRVTSRSDADRLMECVAPYSAKSRRLPEQRQGVHSRHGEGPPVPVMNLLRATRPRPSGLLAVGMWSTFYSFATGQRRPSKNSLAKLGGHLAPWMTGEQTARLKALAGHDYALERIARVRVEEYDGFVYDLRVPDGQNFVCDGVVVHNCIDEIDKMNPNDRSAIHEALEQQRISVAKAGITAVLQARCAVLAAANPKFGRFDENKYIAEQIDLPPTLLSRFDVIFTLIDRPESERDRNMAEHILRGHLVGEWLRRKEEGRDVPEEKPEIEEPYTPHFEPIFFRKYVAFAKRVSPVMTQESMDAIKAKYLEIRKTGEGAGVSVPITPRQLEAIIRLSEASARARLSSAVAVEDTERAIRITEYWMRRVAGEEGRFDIDIVQVGISQSQREQIMNLREVIGQLSEQSPSGAADYEDVVRAAGERGMNATNVDKWLKRWAEEGDIYSPAKNKYKLVERL